MNYDVKPQVYCPFGCTLQEADENGYCAHLVGFTNSTPEECKQGKGTVEVIQPLLRGANETPTGRVQVVGGKHAQRVLPTDVLVNPERTQLVNGVQSRVYAWVSSRVYRKDQAAKKAS